MNFLFNISNAPDEIYFVFSVGKTVDFVYSTRSRADIFRNLAVFFALVLHGKIFLSAFSRLCSKSSLAKIFFRLYIKKIS